MQHKRQVHYFSYFLYFFICNGWIFFSEAVLYVCSESLRNFLYVMDFIVIEVKIVTCSFKSFAKNSLPGGSFPCAWGRGETVTNPLAGTVFPRYLPLHFFYRQLGLGPGPQSCLYFQDFQCSKFRSSCLEVWPNKCFSFVFPRFFG